MNEISSRLTCLATWLINHSSTLSSAVYFFFFLPLAIFFVDFLGTETEKYHRKRKPNRTIVTGNGKGAENCHRKRKRNRNIITGNRKGKLSLETEQEMVTICYDFIFADHGRISIVSKSIHRRVLWTGVVDGHCGWVLWASIRDRCRGAGTKGEMRVEGEGSAICRQELGVGVVGQALR